MVNCEAGTQDIHACGRLPSDCRFGPKIVSEAISDSEHLNSKHFLGYAPTPS